MAGLRVLLILAPPEVWGVPLLPPLTKELPLLGSPLPRWLLRILPFHGGFICNNNAAVGFDFVRIQLIH